MPKLKDHHMMVFFSLHQFTNTNGLLLVSSITLSLNVQLTANINTNEINTNENEYDGTNHQIDNQTYSEYKISLFDKKVKSKTPS